MTCTLTRLDRFKGVMCVQCQGIYNWLYQNMPIKEDTQLTNTVPSTVCILDQLFQWLHIKVSWSSKAGLKGLDYVCICTYIW